MFKFFIVTAFIIANTSANNKCSSESPPLPKYNLIERCHRSTLGIAAKANYTSLTSCQRLGIEKKALALNFSPEMTFKEGEPSGYTCEVLKCAEAEGGLSLKNDTRYDYYSIYGQPLPFIVASVNSTCVPATGMFFLLPKRRNYTQAQAKCRDMSGVLADVTSEQRTDALALLLSNAGVKAAYVGMWSGDHSVFQTNNDALDCTSYRAWAPGFPRRSPNMTCVLLTRTRTWKTSSCHAKFQALCELIPGGPYKRGSIFPPKRQNGTQNSVINSDY